MVLNYQQIKELKIPLQPKPEQGRIVAKMKAVRGLLSLYGAKIQRTLSLVWGTATA